MEFVDATLSFPEKVLIKPMLMLSLDKLNLMDNWNPEKWGGVWKKGTLQKGRLHHIDLIWTELLIMFTVQIIKYRLEFSVNYHIKAVLYCVLLPSFFL